MSTFSNSQNYWFFLNFIHFLACIDHLKDQKFTCSKSHDSRNSHFKIAFLAKFTFLKSHCLTKIAFVKSHFSQKSQFRNPFFTKIAFSKSHFSQKSHFQNRNFSKKNPNFKISVFRKIHIQNLKLNLTLTELFFKLI